MSSSDLDDEIVALSVNAERMEEGVIDGSMAVDPNPVDGGGGGDGGSGIVLDGDGRGDRDGDGGDPSHTETAPLLGAQAQTRQSYDAVSPALPKKSKKDKDKDKGKSGQKLVADALKTDMAAERTFFKWLWTGLHVGAIGTFIFVTFDTNKEDPYRLLVVAFAWTVAFGLVLYGLFTYNRRREALRQGRMEVLPWITREYGPCIVVGAVALVVCTGLAYAVFSGASAKESSKSGAFHGL
jgi:uncharacterized membrane protein YidH (DUF202 family)